MNDTRRDIILATVTDTVTCLLWDNRKDDEELLRGEIEEALAEGEITVDEIVAAFRNALAEGLLA